MTRPTVARLVALLVLLVHSSSFAAASVFDGILAARANNTAAHVEADAGPDCVTHDEATCQLCQVRHASGSIAPADFVLPVATRSGPAARAVHTFRAGITPSALHSRAPPIA